MVRTRSDQERFGTYHNIASCRMLHVDAALTKLENRLGYGDFEGLGEF